MSKDWIINDAYFGKIKDLPIMGETIKQFLDDVVYKHPNWSILLQNLSDIYVLVASLDAQRLLKGNEKSWKEIMKKDEYDILEKNRYFVVAYMLVNEKHQNNHYIDLFDTIIRNNNLGCVMIEKYQEKYEYMVNLVPQQIIQSSAKYWAKVLDFYCEDLDTGKKYIDKNLIEEYIESFELDSNDLDWEHLYNLCYNDD
jgi:hypothetical protein